ncbi:hypothetical protein [uncultured Pelagimonas sp.]|uniref:hypothetical protein n=1 Tax=uncultured Pelagimonas sp. TaxID=1618102 RepID=UPI00260CF3FE|nr:hypothetical protein [uncultured Pelagimonas sp.]
MVSCIPLPDVCETDLLNAVVAERQGGVNRNFFNEIHVEWTERVQAYVAERGNPQSVPTWPFVTTPRNSKKFLTLYNSPKPGAAQAEVLRQLRQKHGYQFCPSCGEAGNPDTLDHYLPKKKFPHFAVTVSNLTPMCGGCQRRKSDDVGDEANPKFFIHPYFDDFASDQLLQLEINPPFRTPTFGLQVCAGLPEATKGTVEQHVRRLELPKRYRGFFRNRYKRLLKQAQLCRDEGVPFRAFLMVTKAGHEADGKNTWDHIFFFSVLENEDLMTFLEDDELPPLM